MKRSFRLALIGLVALLGGLWACNRPPDRRAMAKPAASAEAVAHIREGIVTGKLTAPASAPMNANLDLAAKSQPAGPNLVPAMPTTTADRYLIKNATARVEVADARAASAELLTSIQSVGGYVGGYNESVDGLGRRTITVQIRVPADKFDESLAKLDPLGKVLDKQVTTQDVTEEYVDTDARSRNLKATEERLLDHLNRAGKLEDILRIEQEISRVREQIERLDGRLRFLNNRVQYSTISVTLSEAPKAEPVVPERTFSTAKEFSEATRSLVEFGQHIWVRIIWLGVWAIIWIPCLLILWLIARRVRRTLGW